MPTEIKDFFTPVDWAVIFGYLILTTIVGHAMRGKQATIKDFFLGGRTLPWWAVCGSILATEISGVTFIGVPATIFALDGNFTYMLWGIGSILGRVLVAWYIVPVYYQEVIYSPYDYMGRRLGSAMKNLATVIFTIGSILAQSVRVLVAALPLKVVTGMDFSVCIMVIGIFAIVWTLMGGMQTVIWTDVMQFVIFLMAGLMALFWISSQVDGGFFHVWEVASADGKTVMWDGRWGFGKELEFTFWVAILAVPFQNLTAFGVDQLNAQRMFCCRNVGDARKALIFSSFGQLLTLLMLLVGAALWVFYKEHPPTGAVQAYLQFDAQNTPRGTGGGDSVFPTWIVTQLPIGMRGLILAGLFAAAISSLDSILAALSQTTLSLFTKHEHMTSDESSKKLVFRSKMLVIFWGIVLSVFTLGMNEVRKMGIPVLPLAFGMTAYTMGPMLAFMVGALTRKATFWGLLVGAVVSIVLAMFVRADIWVFFKDSEPVLRFLSNFPTYQLTPIPDAVPPAVTVKLSTVYCYAWLWPVTAFLTFGCGYVSYLLGKKRVSLVPSPGQP